MCLKTTHHLLLLLFPLVYKVCLLVGYLTSQQRASVSQGRICTNNFVCCHTEIEVADQTFYITQSQYTDTRPTSPSADPITPGAWQGNHWSGNFYVTGMTRPRKNPGASRIQTRDLPHSKRTPQQLGQRGGSLQRPKLCSSGFEETIQRFVLKNHLIIV